VAVNFDYEQAGELKIGQVGIANLRIRTLDVERLVQEMREQPAPLHSHGSHACLPRRRLPMQ